MTRRTATVRSPGLAAGVASIVLSAMLGGSLLTLTGCPDNPYKAETYIKKLSDPKEAERAVADLESLGDPKAIPAIGKAWADQGEPARFLEVIISLAAPLTKKEAADKFLDKDFPDGRPSNWDKAVPFLTKALADVDPNNSRSVDAAGKAAGALGAAGLDDGLDALVTFASQPTDKKMITAQIAAIKAMGKFTGDNKQRALAALLKIIAADGPAHPRTAPDAETRRAAQEKYGQWLGTVGAAINALTELRSEASTSPLLLALCRTPELFTQIRRALVASGPQAVPALRKILQGENAEVNELFKTKHLDTYCGDRNDRSGDACDAVSAKDFYFAVVLGDFYDAAAVPELLEAATRKPLPVYYQDEVPSPNTQLNAIYDALRKIGSEQGADQIYKAWADPKADLTVRGLAIGAYPFIVRNNKGVEELGKIAASDAENDQLRQGAATAFARMAKTPESISALDGLVKKYGNESAKKRAEADGAPKVAYDAAKAAVDAAKKPLDEANQAFSKVSANPKSTAAEITAAANAVKPFDAAYKVAKDKLKKDGAPYKQADAEAKDYHTYQRMFQTHIARIEIAIRCGDDVACYGKTLTQSKEDAATNAGKYIADIASWTDDEKATLLPAQIERAMLELAKRGATSEGQTQNLLDAIASKGDDRMIRQSILLALPKIAKLPCASCLTKLDLAVKAGEGKSMLGELNTETLMLRNYFSWAGGRTEGGAAPADTTP